MEDYFFEKKGSKFFCDLNSLFKFAADFSFIFWMFLKKKKILFMCGNKSQKEEERKGYVTWAGISIQHWRKKRLFNIRLEECEMEIEAIGAQGERRTFFINSRNNRQSESEDLPDRTFHYFRAPKYVGRCFWITQNSPHSSFEALKRIAKSPVRWKKSPEAFESTKKVLPGKICE